MWIPVCVRRNSWALCCHVSCGEGCLTACSLKPEQVCLPSGNLEMLVDSAERWLADDLTEITCKARRAVWPVNLKKTVQQAHVDVFRDLNWKLTCITWLSTHKTVHFLIRPKSKKKKWKSEVTLYRFLSLRYNFVVSCFSSLFSSDFLYCSAYCSAVASVLRGAPQFWVLLLLGSLLLLGEWRQDVSDRYHKGSL